MAALSRSSSFSFLRSKVRTFYSCSAVCQQSVSSSGTSSSASKDVLAGVFDESSDEPKKMSKAMKAYMERAKVHDNFVKEQLREFNIGKRHLANMMGKDPEFFTQADIDEAICYLFPSGLFDPRARPIMKHPDELYPKRKAAEFDMNGRPFHSMFYTSKPNYFKLLHDVALKFKELNKREDQMISKGVLNGPADDGFLSGSEWLPQVKMEEMLLEKITENNYTALINALERLGRHPYGHLEKDFIQLYRKQLTAQTELQVIPELVKDASCGGRPYTTHESRRKRATATVKVIGQGTGQFEINGRDIHYFEERQDKEQVLFPLIFSGQLGKVDVVATVSGGGMSGQAGALRHGLSMCLRAFVDAQTMERMRLAGLLSFDPRHRERKKPGQEGARAKFTWKRR